MTNAKIEKNVYTYKYWTKSLESQEAKWFPHVPKVVKRLNLRRYESHLSLPSDNYGEGAEEGENEQLGSFDDEGEKDVFFSLDHGEEEEEEERGGGEEETEKIAPEGSAIAQFVDFLLSPRFYRVTAIAHNSSAFDSILLLRELRARHAELRHRLE